MLATSPAEEPGYDKNWSMETGEFLANLMVRGVKSRVGMDGSFWICSERYTLSRYPFLPAPSPEENTIKSFFSQKGVMVLDYLLPTNENMKPSAHVYLFKENEYDLDRLSKAGRRDARKAIRELDIGWISHAQLMTHGARAYADCRRRVGLDDGTNDLFFQRFGNLDKIPGYHFLGAWRNNILVAFMTLEAVADCVSIAVYSDNEHRSSCPSDGLISFALNYCINERKISLISYGLSSIQEQSKAGSLHQFKLKVGFHAVPVRRVFRLHPWIRPFVNKASQHILHLLMRVMPGNRVIKKGSGMLTQLLLEGVTEKAMRSHNAS